MEKVWDNGFRQVTTSVRPINTPADLHGLKMRVPVSALWTSLFKSLGASPTGINFAEVYSALQTHVVDGQENPPAIIYAAKLYQAVCSFQATFLLRGAGLAPRSRNDDGGLGWPTRLCRRAGLTIRLCLPQRCRFFPRSPR
jgi:hypothetical protein